MTWALMLPVAAGFLFSCAGMWSLVFSVIALDGRGAARRLAFRRAWLAAAVWAVSGVPLMLFQFLGGVRAWGS